MQVKKKRGPTADPTFGPRAGEGDQQRRLCEDRLGGGSGHWRERWERSQTSWQNFGFKKPKGPAT